MLQGVFHLPESGLGLADIQRFEREGWQYPWDG